ncbi:hypothetical protein [Microbacterium sp. C7(2022)]|uniref:hypothetical protein n=1 Tax=Microbacterium sp. C7(2022) TaxID=2992759 RepID=UPI00237B6DD5|nr:hypothetical protein [Microbacterium sp. C7(2022)]MDE0546036.1 hypothetical protein [Microbacterium sp. C7(2022)]
MAAGIGLNRDRFPVVGHPHVAVGVGCHTHRHHESVTGQCLAANEGAVVLEDRD